jgi:hypothetical protein
MPYDLNFPIQSRGAAGYVYDTPSTKLNRLCFELDNLLGQLKAQFRFALTENILKSHLLAQVKKHPDIQLKVLTKKGVGGFELVLNDGAGEVTVKAVNTPHGLTGGKYCVACGAPKTGQKIVSHGAVPASAWSEIVCSALEDLGVNLATLTPQEKNLAQTLMNIGEKAKASADFPAADDESVSMCKSCEELHGNMSVIQRHRWVLTKPVGERTINMVGPQFGATLACPEGNLQKLEQITRNTARRVITAMEVALQEELPPKFVDTSPNRSANLRFARPPVRYASDPGGQYQIPVTKNLTQVRQTTLVELLEHILMNLDLFTHRLSYHAFRVCSLPQPATRRRL